MKKSSLLLLLLAVTGNATASLPAELIGTWQTPCVSEKDSSSQTVMRFNSDGSFDQELRVYGGLNGDTQCVTFPSEVHPRPSATYAVTAQSGSLTFLRVSYSPPRREGGLYSQLIKITHASPETIRAQVLAEVIRQNGQPLPRPLAELAETDAFTLTRR